MAKIESINFHNRWKQKRYNRLCDWLIFGLQKWVVSPSEYCYKFCFFGLEVSFWMRKNYKKQY